MLAEGLNELGQEVELFGMEGDEGGEGVEVD